MHLPSGLEQHLLIRILHPHRLLVILPKTRLRKILGMPEMEDRIIVLRAPLSIANGGKLLVSATID
jgi:hypothetical protein